MSQESSAEGAINTGIKEVLAGAGAYDLTASYNDFITNDYSAEPVALLMFILGLDYGDKLIL